MEGKGKLSDVQWLLLGGHLCSCLSVFLLSAGGLLRLLRMNGDLPERPISFGGAEVRMPSQMKRPTTSYFDR